MKRKLSSASLLRMKGEEEKLSSNAQEIHISEVEKWERESSSLLCY